MNDIDTPVPAPPTVGAIDSDRAAQDYENLAESHGDVARVPTS